MKEMQPTSMTAPDVQTLLLQPEGSGICPMAVDTTARCESAIIGAAGENIATSVTNRRTLLHNLGIFAGAGVLTSLVAKQADAQSPEEASADVGIAGANVPLPSLPIIALNRMGFGPRQGDIEAFLALGATPEASFEAYVEQQLNPAAIDDSTCDAKIAEYGFTTLGKSRMQLWQDHVKKPDIGWNERIKPIWEIERTTLLRAVYSKRQLNEVLADFWHNHFNVYGWDHWTIFVHYDRDVIRANMLGNFRQMLEAVATSPAMIYYLDNISNSSAGPNENYARELFELHTLGAENYAGVLNPAEVPLDDSSKPKMYVDEDVYEATKCFTGWRINQTTGEFVFDDKVHEKYTKNVLQTRIDPFLGVRDGQTVLDLLANHKGTATYISRKLCCRLISDTPAESIVQKVADVFYNQRNAPDQLKQVIRTILLSDEFRTSWAQKIKRPLEYAASALRTINHDFSLKEDQFFWYYEPAGQPLFSWRTPDGYPDRKESWSSTMPMLQRWRFTNFVLLWWKYGGTGADKDKVRVDLVGQTPANITTPIQLVDYWSSRILGYALSDNERQAMINFVAQGRNQNFNLPTKDIAELLPNLVGLILMSPTFLWR